MVSFPFTFLHSCSGSMQTLAQAVDRYVRINVPYPTPALDVCTDQRLAMCGGHDLLDERPSSWLAKGQKFSCPPSFGSAIKDGAPGEDNL